MNWKKLLLGCTLFIAIERFCYFQTGTFALPKMVHEGSPPSPTSPDSQIHLEQPLRFIGAGKQFFAFETADGKYVVKFMKWSRRRPLPWLEKLPLKEYLAKRARLASNLQQSSQLALEKLSRETQLVIPALPEKFTLIDKLGITHTVASSSVHFYVQRKAVSFTDHFNNNPTDSLIHSFIHTVATQCRSGVVNLDPVIDRNYGVVDNHVILLDIGSFLKSPKLHHTAAIQHEIVLELLPLRAWIQKNHPEYLATFDRMLSQELDSF